MNVGFYSSPSPEKKRWWNHRLLRAVHNIWHLVFCCLFFFSGFLAPYKSSPLGRILGPPQVLLLVIISNACLVTSKVVFAFWHHPHIPPIQSSSKYIRRIIPKSWFCSTSLWIRQYVQVPNIPWYAFCVLGRIFTWQMVSLHAHFMPHLQNCLFECLCFYLEKTPF